MTTTTESRDEEVAQSAPGWVWTLLVIICLLLAIIVGVRGCNKKAEAKKAATAEYAKAHSPTVRVIVPTERPWTSRTFEIPPEGLRIRLEPGPKIYPKFGAITEETPSGITNKNEPGIDRSFGFEPSGYWTFRADPSGSVRLVEIYNRWQ